MDTNDSTSLPPPLRVIQVDLRINAADAACVDDGRAGLVRFQREADSAALTLTRTIWRAFGSPPLVTATISPSR